MKTYKIVLILLIMFTVTSCANTQSLQSKEKVKSIKLVETIDTPYVIYENEEAILYFSRTKVIDLLENEINKSKSKRRNEMESRKLLTYIIDNERKELAFKDPLKMPPNNAEELDYASVLYNWLAKEMLLTGEAKVFNKNKNEYVKEIYFSKSKDNLGNYIESFKFKDSTEFLQGKIMLGE